MSLTTIIGPLMMNNLFTFFTSEKAPFHFPGIPFFLAALFMLSSLIIAWSLLNKETMPAAQKTI